MDRNASCNVGTGKKEMECFRNDKVKTINTTNGAKLSGNVHGLVKKRKKSQENVEKMQSGLDQNSEKVTVEVDLQHFLDPIFLPKTSSQNNDIEMKTECSENEKCKIVKGFKRTDKRYFETKTCKVEGCGKLFHRLDRYKKHLLLHKNVKNYKCDAPHCLKSYSHPSHLKRHKKISHGGKKLVKTKAFPCPYVDCDKIYKSKPSMLRHIELRHVRKVGRYTCEICAELFEYKHDFHTHLIENHNIKLLACDKCNIAFTSDRAKKRHERSHRKFYCEKPQCSGLEFENFSLKRKHDLQVHPYTFYCDHCDFSTNRKYHIREHVQKHLSIYDRPLYRCDADNCGRIFQHERNYNSHYRAKHLGNKVMYKCQVCQKTFQFHHTLKRHIMNLHDTPRPEKLITPSESLPFLCEYINCGKRFKYKQNINRHCRTAHLQCDQTDYRAAKTLTTFVKPQLITVKKPASLYGKYDKSRLKHLNHQNVDDNIVKISSDIFEEVETYGSNHSNP